MDVNTAILGRRSVREFTLDPVNEKTIAALIDAAIRAPSAVDQQPCTFTVVRNQKRLGRISTAAKEHILPTLPASAHSVHFLSRLTDPNFHIFYHAPVLLVISADKQGPWIVEDCALAAENLMLSACAVGLGSCWIGFAQSYLNTPAGKMELDLPTDWVPVAPIVVGYPRTAAPFVPRRPPVVKWID